MCVQLYNVLAVAFTAVYVAALLWMLLVCMWLACGGFHMGLALAALANSRAAVASFIVEAMTLLFFFPVVLLSLVAIWLPQYFTWVPVGTGFVAPVLWWGAVEAVHSVHHLWPKKRRRPAHDMVTQASQSLLVPALLHPSDPHVAAAA